MWIALFKKFIRLIEENKNFASAHPAQTKYVLSGLTENEKSVYRKVNQTLAKFDVEIDNFRFNTAIAALMELMNELSKNLKEVRDDLKLIHWKDSRL